MTEALYMVAVVALCTFLTRVLPFLLFGGKGTLPKAVRYLGTVLPATVMAILVVYCLKSLHFHSAGGFLPALLSVAVVVLLHLWKRSNLLSIGGGTVCYMLLVQLVFA